MSGNKGRWEGAGKAAGAPRWLGGGCRGTGEHKMALPAPRQREPEVRPPSAEGYDGDRTQTTTARPPCSSLRRGRPTEGKCPHSCLSCPCGSYSPTAPPPQPCFPELATPKPRPAAAGGGVKGGLQHPRNQRCHAGCPAARYMQLCRQRAGLGTGRAACLALAWVLQEPLLARLPVLPAFAPRAAPCKGLSYSCRSLSPPSRPSAPFLCARGRAAHLALRPGCGEAPHAALAGRGGLLAPKPWGWRAQCVQPLSGHTGAPGPDCGTPEPLFWSEPCSSPLGAPRKLPSVRGAQGDRQGCCEHPMGTCVDQLPPAMPSREKLRAGGEELELPARLAFSPSRHARQKQLTKTRGVNKNR